MTKSKWEFVTLGPEGNLVPLPEDRLYKIGFYERILETAARSAVAKPPFSNYFCKESIGVQNGSRPVEAGNIEYGWCQAIHGEESAVSAYRAAYGRRETTDMKSVALGIIASDSDGRIPNPCGNCRDVMLEDLGTDFEIVSGSADGGTAIVVGMKHFLFENPTPEDLDVKDNDLRPWLTPKAKFAVDGCEGIGNDAYAPYGAKNPHPEREYGAMLQMDMPLEERLGNKYFGAHDVMVDYHPIYAVRDAIRAARRTHDIFIKEVVIVSPHTAMPHVMYKDRQHLMEFHLQGELVLGKQSDPPVYLLTYDRELYKKEDRMRLTGAWQTSVKEWLPFAFSPRNFGPDFLEYLTKFFQNGSKRD